MFCFMIVMSSLKSLLRYETKDAEYWKFICFDNFTCKINIALEFFLFQPTNAQTYHKSISL